MLKVLLIDDDTVFCDLLSHVSRDLGVHCDCTQSDILGQTLLHNQPYDILFVDATKLGLTSQEAVSRINAAPSCPAVVLVAFAGSGVDAATAIELGAWDFLEKPVAIPYLRELMQRIVAYSRNKRGKRRDGLNINRDRIIGQSPKLLACLASVGQAAHSGCCVFIHGETGTGKERIAHAIHDNSDRAGKPFVVVDCTNIPETLAESLLFGHVKGSFTGADSPRDGFFRQAEGGSIFLDEVGDLSLDVQKSLLRVLQEHSFRPLGARKEVRGDFRVVSASNRNLESLVREGRFRSDLYYRLCAMQIILPPLRERTGDVALLAAHYAAKIRAEYGQEPTELSPDCLRVLDAYSWPGNIRELINVLYFAVTESDGEARIYPHHLPVNIRVAAARAVPPGNDSPAFSASSEDWGGLPSLRVFREKYLEKAERDYLELLRAHSKSSVPAACALADITRARLYQLLKKYNFTFK